MQPHCPKVLSPTPSGPALTNRKVPVHSRAERLPQAEASSVVARRWEGRGQLDVAFLGHLGLYAAHHAQREGRGRLGIETWPLGAVRVRVRVRVRLRLRVRVKARVRLLVGVRVRVRRAPCALARVGPRMRYQVEQSLLPEASPEASRSNYLRVHQTWSPLYVAPPHTVS